MPAAPPVVRLIEAAAQRLGYEFTVLDPTFGHLCEVRNGDRSLVLIGGVSPVNALHVGRLCKDKHYAGLVLARAGYRIPRTVRCLSPHFFTRPDYASQVGLAPASRFAQDVGMPVLVKPNRMSKGIGVTAADTAAAMHESIEALWAAHSHVVLVQERVPGRDFRLDFVGDEFVGGYERRQLVVTGDGRSNLRDRLAAVDPRWADDAFVARCANEGHDLDLDHVLSDGETRRFGSDIVLNLNQLATGVVIEQIPDAWRRYCLGIGKAVGARHFGVDVRAPGLDHDPASLVVIEINDSPLLTGMFELGHEELAVRGQSKALQLALG